MSDKALDAAWHDSPILLLPRQSHVQDELVQAFVFTPNEKRALVFVLTAFLLGLATKQYRDIRPPATTGQQIHFKSSSRASSHPLLQEVTQKRKKQDLASD